MREIDYSLLPEHIQDGMRRYIENGIEPGSFCCAVLENNLVRAFGAADHINQMFMRDIAEWLYNSCPRSAWGCGLTVQEWIDRGGLKGIEKLEQGEK